MHLQLLAEGQHVPPALDVTALPIRSYTDRDEALEDLAELQSVLAAVCGVTAS
jgi:hypothetical protein